MAAVEAPSIRIFVDDEPHDAVADELVIDVLTRAGSDLPHVCYNPGLGPLKSCDTCLVEIGGRVVRACETRVRDGLRVSARSERALSRRKQGLERLARNHHFRCTICDNNNGDCALHDAARTLRLDRQEFRPKPYPIDDSSPFYRYDPSQCILCGRCVEACQDLVVNEVLHIDWGLTPPRVVWDSNAPVRDSTCVGCGACVTACPVDALLEKTFVGRGGLLTGLPEATKRVMVDATSAIDGSFQPLLSLSDAEAAMRKDVIRRTKTVCTFCGVGCSFDVWTRQRSVIKVKPRPESPANGLATCVKGKFGWGHINSPERLTRPLIRDGSKFRTASWEEAIALIARRLGEIRTTHGPDSLYVIASCTDTNEEVYLTQKLARAVLGTNNVDNCSRYCQSPATVGLWRTVGYGGDAGSIEDLARAELVVIIGSNTAEAHPVIASRIKRAHKLDGHKLVVLDPRKHEMARRADLWLSPRSGTDLVLLNAVSRYILDRGWEATAFLAERVNGLDAFRASLGPYTLEYAEHETGIDRSRIIRLASMIHEARSVAVPWAMGVTQHQDGSETSTAISNLLLLTGNYGRPGTGGYPLRGHANVQGASDFGALPNYFPGYQKLEAPGVREKFEATWGGPLPPKPGLTSVASVDAILSGKIHGMLIVGEDKLLADSDMTRTGEAFRRLDFLAVIEPFFTRTAQFADVVLPAALSLEKEGTFVNTERRIQRLYRAMPPLDGTRTDFDTVIDIANALGARWSYRSSSEVMDEIRALVPIFAGVRYDRLEGYRSLRWPVAEDGTDSPYLYADRFAFPDGKAVLYPTQFVPPLAPDREFDVMVDNGRLLEHFHWRSLTGESAGLVGLVPEMFIEVSPALAKEKGIASGDTVRLVSRSGAVVAKAWVTDRVQGRTVFLPLHGRTSDAVNLLTGAARDSVAATPAYKEIPARIERVRSPGGEPEPPVPRANFRRAVAAPPQVGIRIEEKWKRSDFQPIVER